MNSDEVLYYFDGDFMSRKGVGQYDNPSGLPHGPHPGTMEAPIGKPATAETAVMFDTFRPLKVTADVSSRNSGRRNSGNSGRPAEGSEDPSEQGAAHGQNVE